MKVLITGNKGFVGSATQKYFESKGIEVIGYDIQDGQDLNDWHTLYNLVDEERPDVILHEAAIAQFSEADKDPLKAHEVNVLGTKNICNAARRHNTPLVYASTGSVYMPFVNVPITEEDPARGNSVYGVCKAIAEKYVEQTPRWMSLRYAHLYGAEKVGHGLIGGYLARIKKNEKPQLHGGDQTNDFTYIDDICEANYLAVKNILDNEESWNQHYNIGTGTELSAKEAGDILCDVVGWKGGVEVTPKRGVDPERFAFDCSKAERLLGFKAKVDFKEGLRRMLETR